MEPEVLLAHLKALLGRAPDFSNYSPASQEQHAWRGQTHSLIRAWDRAESASLKVTIDFIPMSVGREKNIANVFGVIHRAISDLELRVPAEQQVSFGAGDVYDFFRALRKIVESAESEIFVVDPYLDNTVFDQYLTARNPDVTVRLLVKEYANDVTAARDKYVAQHGAVVVVKQSAAIHDRVIFTDNELCWVVGQSIKDAAKAKPTYLVPLSPDVAMAKLSDYNTIWESANAL